MIGHAQVRKTQKAIKHVLTERYYAWEDALEFAKGNPMVNFKKDGKKVTTRPEFLVSEVSTLRNHEQEEFREHEGDAGGKA